MSARFSKIGMKSRRFKTKSSQSVIATASAERSSPSTNAISPKMSPGCIILRTISFPSAETEVILAAPRNTAIILCPGEPLA